MPNGGTAHQMLGGLALLGVLHCLFWLLTLDMQYSNNWCKQYNEQPNRKHSVLWEDPTTCCGTPNQCWLDKIKFPWQAVNSLRMPPGIISLSEKTTLRKSHPTLNLAKKISFSFWENGFEKKPCWTPAVLFLREMFSQLWQGQKKSHSHFEKMTLSKTFSGICPGPKNLILILRKWLWE